MKTGVYLVLGFLVVGGASGYWFLWRDKDGEGPGVEFRTARVDRGEVVDAIAASGTVEPIELVQVGTQISGVVNEILTDWNARVNAGDPIARLDSRRLAAQVAQDEAALTRANADVERVQALLSQSKADVDRARAVLAQSEAEIDRMRASLSQGEAEVSRATALLAQAKAELDRQRRLVEQRATPQGDLDAAIANEAALAAQLASAKAALRQLEAQLSSARINVSQMEAEVEGAEAMVRQNEAQLKIAQATILERTALLDSDRVNLGYATIVSPVSGVVVSRSVEVGQTVAASLQTPTLFAIAKDLTRVRVLASVPEADIGRIHEGQTASFTVDAHPDRVFPGTVHQIRLASTSVQNVVTYPVIVDATNPEGLLLPGMTANVSFEVRRSEKDVLRVPATALRVHPTEDLVVAGNAPSGSPEEARGERAVYVRTEDGRLRRIPVQVGITDGVHSEVEPIQAGSLEAGMEIVTAILKEEEPTSTNPFAPRGMGGPRRGH